jgi:hypothetical protein
MSIPFPQRDQSYRGRPTLGDIGDSGLAGEIVESEYFTQPSVSFGKIKIGGVFTDIVNIHFKTGGVMTSIISKKVKTGGVFA